MARIFPDRLTSEFRQNHNSKAEIQLYDALKENLGKEYSVYFSRTWINRNANGKIEQGEADFVITHPDFGILIIEVKGGKIEIDGHQDKIYSLDQNGVRHQIKDPWKQAESSKFILLHKIRSLPNWKDRWIDIGSAVAFCDLYENPNLEWGISRPSELIIFKDDLQKSNLQKKIESIYSFWSKKKSLGIDGVYLIEKMLAPTLKIENPLKRDIDNAEKELLELKEQQFELLEMISENQRLLIQGAAGTGKTVILLEKARRFANDGLNTLVICFSPTLRNFLRKSMDTHPNMTIASFDELLANFTSETNTQNPFLGRDPFSLSWDEKKHMSDLLLNCIEESSTRYEAILVDEGQDFHHDWWTAMELLLSETPEKYFYIFYDKSQIVDNKKVIFPTYMMNYSLTQNIRNTIEIHNVASNFYHGAKINNSGVSGNPVEFFELSNQNDYEKKILTIINQLYTVEKVSLDQIGVLMPEPIDDAFKSDKKFGNFVIANANNHTNGKNQILFESISKFKGLERSIIILCNLEKILKPGQINITELYVGLSRPRAKLIIVGMKHTIDFIKQRSK